ncbi:exo-poly-alpha-D-galacturonosidase [Bacteroides sp. An51A]|uniref:exo-poly-alpha-D-galacturonosidase n=1 Tax=Bacteroides sp. An51A TaxID=1965640 RepID=UPI000B375226|nr:exo-poly-alpha-D-galacturonosidase [Bacteroides sp. An51A]OUN77915.1 exo-poly-alpha-D-galacturonosidase [Bacteroides sp. An51A]
MHNNEYSQIPFSECQVMTDDDGQNIYIYHNGSEVLSDYNHTGFYLETAIALFMAIKDQNQSWMNLGNLWKLRNCIRENLNHNLKLDRLIYGESFDGSNVSTLTPLTESCFYEIIKEIQSLDEYATI